nr:DNA-binding protein [Tawny frogmouth aviadenovirus A]
MAVEVGALSERGGRQAEHAHGAGRGRGDDARRSLTRIDGRRPSLIGGSKVQKRQRQRAQVLSSESEPEPTNEETDRAHEPRRVRQDPMPKPSVNHSRAAGSEGRRGGSSAAGGRKRKAAAAEEERKKRQVDEELPNTDSEEEVLEESDSEPEPPVVLEDEDDGGSDFFSEDEESARAARPSSGKKRSAGSKAKGGDRTKRAKMATAAEETLSEDKVDASAESFPGAEDPFVYSTQKAMACLEKMCHAIDVRWQGADVSPDNAIWSKIAAQFVRRRHPEYRRTFSSAESFHSQLGRFLAAMVYAEAELEAKVVPGGVYIWRHGWFRALEGGELSKGAPRCLHGVEMSAKPRTVELNPSSEAGKRAIADQGATVERNRYGRQVVVIHFPENVVCSRDASHAGFPHPHAHGSCGMVFSDGSKALRALKHDVEWTGALYPRADQRRAREMVLLCVCCCCNYLAEGPIAGRQTCRMTPYKLGGAGEISSTTARGRPDMEAHQRNPFTMVFTCCNPQSASSGNRAGAQRQGGAEMSCNWKISAMDLRYAYVFATELATEVFGHPPTTKLPEFKWNEGFAFKTEVITPVAPQEATDLFA